MCPTAKGKGVEMIQASDSWRNTTTQERDTIVGHKLQEVTELADYVRRQHFCLDKPFWLFLTLCGPVPTPAKLRPFQDLPTSSRR